LPRPFLVGVHTVLGGYEIAEQYLNCDNLDTDERCNL
jgi:hypothetical protein